MRHNGAIGRAEGAIVESGSRAKRDVWTFLALLLLFSSFFYGLVFLRPAAAKQLP